MQWLVDLVIEMIGIPPVYVHRGDPADYDFAAGDLTIDGNPHTLDLSAIVPAGASSIEIVIRARDNLIDSFFSLRHPDNVNIRAQDRVRTQVANVFIEGRANVGCNAAREVVYISDNVTWTFLYLTVKGWWL